jgi:prepilin-type N-terminal cleavage/methylation domain-containing protein
MPPRINIPRRPPSFARSAFKRSAFKRSAFKRPAFTLVELLIVIAIMGVISAMAIPRYADSIARYRAEMGAKRIAADLEFASSQARQLGRPVVVEFNSVGSRYTLIGVKSLNNSGVDYSVNIADAPYLASLNAASFGSGGSVTFDIYGRASAAGSITIRSGTFVKTTTLNQSSGKATVQ